MAKKKVEEIEVTQEELSVLIAPLEFADLNTVKDKINEIIALING